MLTGQPATFIKFSDSSVSILTPAEIYGSQTARPDRRAGNDSQHTFSNDFSLSSFIKPYNVNPKRGTAGQDTDRPGRQIRTTRGANPLTGANVSLLVPRLFCRGSAHSVQPFRYGGLIN